MDHELELLEAAVHLLRRRYAPRAHVVATALRSTSGRIHLGLHLGASVARASICAEAVALGLVIMSDDGAVASGVTVHHHPDTPGWKVVAPCGVCRELLCTHAPGMTIFLAAARENGPGLRGVPIDDLLPDKFTREW